MPTVYITDPIATEVYADLRSRYTVCRAYGHDARTWAEVAPEVDAVLVRSENITAAMIDAAPHLKVIARHGVGFDNVDLEAASARKIWVTITPGANAPAVAEHVFALALSAARKTVDGARAVAAGEWHSAKPRLVGTQLLGKTIGIVGYGRIGRRVATIARGFGMSIVVTDPILSDSDITDEDVRLTALDQLLESSDVVTLHVPLTAETRHMINADSLSRLKDGSIIVNTSRGGLIDEAALQDEIAEGRLYAGLDVIEGEAVSMNDPLPHSRIAVDLPGLVVTPHIAGQSDRSMIDVGNAAAAQIHEALSGREPQYAVNREMVSRAVTSAV